MNDIANGNKFKSPSKKVIIEREKNYSNNINSTFDDSSI